MPETLYVCTEEEFVEKYSGEGFRYFKNEYPILEKFNLPLPMFFLQKFYLADMQERKLTPDETFLNCYDFVFSYFLENYEKPLEGKVQGKSWLGYLVSAYPQAIKTTVQDISNTISKVGNFFSFILSPVFITLLLFLIAFYLWSKIK